MVNSTVQDLIDKAVTERKAGLLNQSVFSLLEALKLADDPAIMSVIYVQQGLISFDCGFKSLAIQQFESAIALATKANNTDRIIEAKRYFVPILLVHSHPDKVFDFAQRTWLLAKHLRRTDLPWFTQGCIDVVLLMATSRARKWEWIKIGFKDLRSVWGETENKKLRMKWLWDLMKSIYTLVRS